MGFDGWQALKSEADPMTDGPKQILDPFGKRKI
jgi:hypothetical protein